MKRRDNFATYFVYIMASPSHTLYTGVTNDLARRVSEHKEGVGGTFTKRYRVNQLVHFEEFTDIRQAIEREKQIKGLLRSKKIALIETSNPYWHDLGADHMNNRDSSLRSE
jgi:putative endonuclease